MHQTDLRRAAAGLALLAALCALSCPAAAAPPQAGVFSRLFSVASSSAPADAAFFADDDLRDAVSDSGAGSRGYVSRALRKLEADDPVGAIALSAQALTVDRDDEAALATLKLAEAQLARKLAVHEDSYRDAVSAAPGEPVLRPAAAPPFEAAPAEREPASDGALPFWRLVFSPVIGLVLLAAAAAHLLLGRTRRRTVAARRRSGSGARDPEAPIPPGYRFVGELGEGGMGVVYEAEDTKLGRRVAIKKMRDSVKRDAREREHFLQEARLVAGLHHPRIVEIYTIVEENEELYLVFEFVRGKTVEKLLTERRFLPLAETKAVLRGVCEALDFAHAHGVVHRDLKPSNIMVSDEGEIKVMDFGVARRAKDSMMRFTTTRTIAGTPLYMAPEAEDGIVCKESDVYALGACLYEMLTGEPPFPSQATRSAKICQRYIAASRQREGLPTSLDALVDWALQPDPSRRLPTPREFLLRLEAIA